MSVPSSSLCGSRCPICAFGITVRPIHENANVPKIPRKSGVRPFMIFLPEHPHRASSLGSQVRLRSFGFNRIKECRNACRPSKAKQHQSEMKGEDEMRGGHENTGKAATAQIRKKRQRAF